MLEYDKIHILEGININKTSASKSVMFFIIGTLKIFGFEHEPYLCNGCQGLIQKAINFNDVAMKCLQNSLLVYEQR